MTMLRAYASLTTANLKMYARNPVASSSLFAALLVLLVVFKLVFTGTGPHAKVAVVNAAGTAAQALVADLRSTATFDVTVTSAADAQTRLSQGNADLEVLIPAGFGALDAAGRQLPVSLEVTYRSGTAGESSLPVLKGVVDGYDETVLGEVPTISLAASALHARGAGPIDFLLPGIVAFNIIGSGLMVAAGTFSSYKSSGVLRRLKATGVSPSVFVFAHATSSFVLGLAQTAGLLLAAGFLFDVHLDVPALFVLVAIGYLVFLAMGLGISGWIRDPQRATATAQSVAFPMIFIALLATSLPPEVSAVTRVLPVSFVTDGLQRLGEGGGSWRCSSTCWRCSPGPSRSSRWPAARFAGTDKRQEVCNR